MTFKCSRCGDCCHTFRLAPVTPSEADDIGVKNVCARGGDSDLEIRRNRPEGAPVWAVDGICVFYKDGCTINDKKPGLCERFECTGVGFVMMVYAIIQGLLREDTLNEEQKQAALLTFLKGRKEINT